MSCVCQLPGAVKVATCSTRVLGLVGVARSIPQSTLQLARLPWTSPWGPRREPTIEPIGIETHLALSTPGNWGIEMKGRCWRSDKHGDCVVIRVIIFSITKTRTAQQLADAVAVIRTNESVFWFSFQKSLKVSHEVVSPVSSKICNLTCVFICWACWRFDQVLFEKLGQDGQISAYQRRSQKQASTGK